MIRLIRDLRLIPIAVVASACLLALKTADLVLEHTTLMTSERAYPIDADPTVVHITPGVPRPSERQRSWAQQMFNFPDSTSSPAGEPAERAPLPAIAPLAADKRNGEIITGSVPDNREEKREAKAQGKPAEAAGKDGPTPPPNDVVIKSDGPPPPSAAERAILERLSERRQELDKRARELDIREGLIAEAEKRLEARLAEIKEAEARVAKAIEKQDEAEAARFKNLVAMYENMKPRDAAKIFDRLEISVLMQVASEMNPRRMADILAQMSADTAERLTVELASRAKAVAKDGNAELPKIEGRPAMQ